MRLDRYLVENSYFESRNRAIEAIKTGKVTLNGKISKPSAKVDDISIIDVADSKFYISRAALKLESFLDKYPVDLKDKTALDIGSSTGGFAQILLENEVSSLVCVDVGSNQLHHSLREHPRLTLHEETDIRTFKNDIQFTLITCDVSFISILQIIGDIDRLASDKCDIIILYKPQFEVGKEVKRDSRGVVQNSMAIESCQEKFITEAELLKWKLYRHAPSEIAGREGNQEYLYHFKKGNKIDNIQ